MIETFGRPTVQVGQVAREWPLTWAVARATPLNAWLARSGLDACGLNNASALRVRLTTSGIPSDPILDRFATLVDRWPDSHIVMYLRGLAERYLPELPVEAALGYLFVAEQDDIVAPLHRGKPLLVALKWLEFAAAEDGWLLEAAGLTPAEVHHGGVPSRETLLTMAALRGVVLPHV